MRAIATLIGLIFTVVVVVAQDAAEPTPQPVYPLCDMAFATVSESLRAGALETGAAVEPSASASPSGQPVPGAGPRTFDELALLDDAVRRCSSVQEFAAASALYPDVLGTIDPLEFLAARCDDPGTDLDQFTVCASLERALATPPPASTPTATPQPQGADDGRGGTEAVPDPVSKPGKGPKPTPGPTTRPDRAQTATPRSPMTKVPSGYRAPVEGAHEVNYFAVKGKTPKRLARNITRQAGRYCGRGAWACVETRFRSRPTYVQDPSTGRCTITGVRMRVTYVAHIPRWTAPRRVPAYMAWWWKKNTARIGWHEAQHVRIAEKYVARLPTMVVGKACTRYDRLAKRWFRSLTRAQNAFDQRDYPRAARASSAWLQEAYDRYVN